MDTADAFNKPDGDGRTPLHHAAVSGRADLVSSMIARGVSVSTVDDALWTPLHSAASAGHAHVLELLLDARADVNARNEGRATALHYALSKGHGDIALKLLTGGADPRIVDASGSTPLHRACSAGRTEAVRLVCDALPGEVLNSTDRLGNTSLHNAALEGHEGVCAALIDAGADVTIANKDRRTALQKCPADVRDRLLARIEV
jgi:26S proteasome non-ATPase regulatory subunit 10